MAHGAPALVGQIHTNQHVARDAHAANRFALPVLDLGHLLHRHLGLEDVVLQVEALGTLLEVLLHAVLVTGVRVDDVPVALQEPQFLAESLDGVDLFGRLAVLALLGLLVILRVGLVGVSGHRVALDRFHGLVTLSVFRALAAVVVGALGTEGAEQLFGQLVGRVRLAQGVRIAGHLGIGGVSRLELLAHRIEILLDRLVDGLLRGRIL